MWFSGDGFIVPTGGGRRAKYILPTSVHTARAGTLFQGGGGGRRRVIGSGGRRSNACDLPCQRSSESIDFYHGKCNTVTNKRTNSGGVSSAGEPTRRSKLCLDRKSGTGGGGESTSKHACPHSLALQQHS